MIEDLVNTGNGYQICFERASFTDIRNRVRQFYLRSSNLILPIKGEGFNSETIWVDSVAKLADKGRKHER